MSHYTLEELIARWKREEVTMEQMIGQLALVLATLEQRLRAVERRVPEERVVTTTEPPKVGPKRR